MGYTEKFKLEVVLEYEKGGVSIESLRHKYNIGGKTTINKWIKLYGKSPLGSEGMLVDEQQILNERIEKLAYIKELEQARIKIEALETMIEISSKLTGIDIKKKFGGKA